MLPNAQQLISTAIRTRRRLLIRYDGYAHARVVEPHMLYRARDGVLTLIAYQVRGYHSNKRRGTFWRPFRLVNIDSVYVTGETFSPRIRQGYKTVSDLINGESIAKVEVTPGDYDFFHRGAYAAPAPAGSERRRSP